MQLLLKGGRVIDPLAGVDRAADVLVEDGRVSAVGAAPDAKIPAECVVDVSGKLVLPGLIDMHVHLREPGLEHKEDIETGSRAAAAGGFTGVAAMPNTIPVTDNRPIVEYICKRGRDVGLARVYPIGAVTKGLLGESMAEIGEMVEGGAVAFSDDAFPLADSGLMRHVMEYCRMFNVPVILHCEDKSLAGDGLMNEGLTSTMLGLRGIPDEVEEISTARNILLARLTGCRTHIAHVSTKGAVELIRRAKEDGIPVTCETCPQYFTLTDELVVGYNTNAKVSPPLRTAEDVEAVKAGLADGTIDVIATDHAPHAIEEKEAEFAVAPPGIIGLETSVGLVMTELVAPGILSDVQAFEKMTATPAKILGIPGGTLAKGAVADITVIDPAREWVVRPEELKSKSKNTPFGGRSLCGKAALTILGGKVVCRDGEIVE